MCVLHEHYIRDQPWPTAIKTKLECPHVQNDRLAAILVIVHWKIATVDLGEVFDKSNQYMKFGSNWVINN